jgi:L-lactate permease
MIEFFFAGLPIAVLVVLMTKPNPLPAPIAFLLAALCAFIVRLYFRAEVALLSAAVVAGLLEALTPISIVFIYLSVLSCVGPMLAVAMANYEFPLSLVEWSD